MGICFHRYIINLRLSCKEQSDACLPTKKFSNRRILSSGEFLKYETQYSPRDNPHDHRDYQVYSAIAIIETPQRGMKEEECGTRRDSRKNYQWRAAITLLNFRLEILSATQSLYMSCQAPAAVVSLKPCRGQLILVLVTINRRTRNPKHLKRTRVKAVIDGRQSRLSSFLPQFLTLGRIIIAHKIPKSSASFGMRDNSS